MRNKFEEFMSIYNKLEKREDSKPKKTQSQKLVELTSDMRLFHDSQGDSYAKIKIDNHFELWNVESETMELILIDRYMKAYKNRVPSDKSIKEAIKVLKAKARLRGKKEKVYTRIAETADAIYIDLCNERWEVIEITKKGWRVIEDSPVNFRRSKIMLTLPRPKENCKIEYLRPFVNVKSDTDFKLIIAWLLSTIKEDTPFPILMLQGEQGSAKSTVSKILRTVVDPSALSVRALPQNEKLIAIATQNTWILAFDNLSGLSKSLSDMFCRLSTGSGISDRTLFTTAEETVIKMKRPCILNGIDDIAQRPDLLERSIVLNLPSIEGEFRIDEKTFWTNFEKEHAGILGALCDIISSALKELPDTRLERKPRMADFALWITAAEKALGWESGTFIKIYEENMEKAINQGLELDMVAVAVQKLMYQRNSWVATTTETFNQLKSYVNEDELNTSAWPAVNKLKDHLRRIAPALRTKGINYTDLPRSSRGGMIQITKCETINN